MSTASNPEPMAGSSVSGFAPHIEDLQEFFRSRGVQFGSSRDLKPFVERLESDAGFCDDTASMLRAIIYRERDGLSPVELMELLATAVAGAEVDNSAASEVREPVRKLMAFVESVFRTRWNPGAAIGGPAPNVVREDPETAATPAPQETARETVAVAPKAAAPPAQHPMTDLFYRAQMVAANGGVAETLTQERKAGETVPPHQPEVTATRAAAELPNSEHWHVPLENFAPPAPERGSWAWLWIAGICALLLAFSAGLIVHQRLTVPLRDPNQPYEPAPAQTPPPAAVPQPAPRASGTAVDADWRARAATSGAVRSAGDERKGASVAEESPTAGNQPKYVAPGVIGASPALMAGRLVYAPPPEYPALARMTRLQGKVTVQAVVDRSGQVVRAEAISGHRLLRGAAVREVYARRYRPYLLDNRPREVATVVTVNFRLK